LVDDASEIIPTAEREGVGKGTPMWRIITKPKREREVYNNECRARMKPPNVTTTTVIIIRW
jgi:hypothetical protein